MGGRGGGAGRGRRCRTLPRRAPGYAAAASPGPPAHLPQAPPLRFGMRGSADGLMVCAGPACCRLLPPARRHARGPPPFVPAVLSGAPAPRAVQKRQRGAEIGGRERAADDPRVRHGQADAVPGVQGPAAGHATCRRALSRCRSPASPTASPAEGRGHQPRCCRAAAIVAGVHQHSMSHALQRANGTPMALSAWQHPSRCVR